MARIAHGARAERQDDRSPVRILTFTSLYPSAERPRHGVFVETRLREILRADGIEARVVAPVPWFPFRSERFGRFARFARTRREEQHGTISVRYPRYVTVPGAGMFTAPFAMARAAVPAIDALLDEGFDFDVIDAHYFYPDGVAAVLLAKRYRRPVQITARGSDVNLLPKFAVPRHLIRWAMTHADVLVAVSGALKRRLVELGAEEADVRVLRNGVDSDMFRPMDRQRAKALLDVTSPRVIVSIGNLVPEKGHDLVIEALPRLSDAMLVIVGDGPQRAELERLAENAGVAQRVRFLPVRAQAELRVVYSAADALVLASSREGWPNVLLEAMACGTPVAATNVGGVPEIVDEACSGILVRERTGHSIAAAVGALLANPPSREAIRCHALRFGWDEVARSQRDIFRSLLCNNH